MEHHRTLKITLQYASDLHKVNLISKMDVYAVVSISNDGDKSTVQKTKTPADREGGRNPAWGFPMKFAVEEAALQQNRLVLDFKLVCERALGDKRVGDVHVPVKELVSSSPATDKTQFVSYQVRKPSGKPKGHLTFSYQFIETSPTVGNAGVGSNSVYHPAGYYPPPWGGPALGVYYLMPGYAYPLALAAQQAPRMSRIGGS